MASKFYYYPTFIQTLRLTPIVSYFAGDTLLLSGVDLLDGTPVLDIKPYIPNYDQLDSGVNDQTEISSNCQTLDNYHRESKPDITELSCMTENRIIDSQKDPGQYNELLSKPVPQQQSDDIRSTLHLHSEAKFEPNVFCRGDELNQHTVGLIGTRTNCESNSSKVNLSNNSDEVVSCQTNNFQINCNRVSCDSQREVETNNHQKEDVKFAKWVGSPPIEKLQVRFTETANKQLNLVPENFTPCNTNTITSVDEFKLNYMKNKDEVREAIINILENDPRSIYRRTKCEDKLYFFTVDSVHVTCWFDYESQVAEVVRLQPVKAIS